MSPKRNVEYFHVVYVHCDNLMVCSSSANVNLVETSFTVSEAEGKVKVCCMLDNYNFDREYGLVPTVEIVPMIAPRETAGKSFTLMQA